MVSELRAVLADIADDPSIRRLDSRQSWKRTRCGPTDSPTFRRLADELVFCFDGDAAGRKAAWRALEVSLPLAPDHKPIRFLFLPDGEDPREAQARCLRDAWALHERPDGPGAGVAMFAQYLLYADPNFDCGLLDPYPSTVKRPAYEAWRAFPAYS